MEPLRNRPAAFFVGAPIGLVGGLIGLGGAEFRLPVLKALFRYPTARAVSLNLLVSLVTLFASLAIRARAVETERLPDLLPVVGGLIAGSMAGAYVGASFASRISARRLERLILILLVTVGSLLVIEAFLDLQGEGIPFGPAIRVPLAALIGLGIGVVSSLLGVAGGELLIPTLVYVFGADIKTAGTASVLISLPAVSVGVWRYARQGAFSDRRDGTALLLPMGIGSIVGALAGGLLASNVAGRALKILLGSILIGSAFRVFRPRRSETG